MIKNSELLKDKGLKITPQRLEILHAVIRLNHPSSDEVLEYVRRNHPHIASGTVYKTLETFVQHGIIHKVKTETGILRYDGVQSRHHHLFSSRDHRLEDYYNEELNALLTEYFSRNEISGFKIDDFRLEITGRFTEPES